MEWREQSSFTCEDAFSEAQRWMEEVTQKSFGSNNFRVALENGVLLCDLMNQLKPGLIKRVNRLSTPIAGLDNVSVFLKACRKLGLNESQLFHPGDLQDLSSRVTLRKEEGRRRLKNVLITIYWLGRKAQLDPFYTGPNLNFKAFEGLLGLALSKALEEGGVCVRDSGYSEAWYPDREDLSETNYRREDSLESTDSLDLKLSHPVHEGCGSDAEAEQGFRMACQPPSLQPHRGYVPPPLLRRKQGRKELGTGSSSPLTSRNTDSFSYQAHVSLSHTEHGTAEEPLPKALHEEEGSEEDDIEADLVLDDFFVRRVQQTLHQTSTKPDCNRFLPRYWTPEEEVRVQKIYLGSQKRPWYRKMQALRACQRPGKRPQVNPGWIWSKSLTDIPMVYPVSKGLDGKTSIDVDPGVDEAGKWKPDHPQKTKVKDIEVKWQDDLNKWKNRRRSTHTDLRKKLQDREHVINQMTNEAGTGLRGTGLRGTGRGGGLSKRDQPFSSQSNPALSSMSTYTSHPPHSGLRPRPNLVRSYAIEAPFSPTTSDSPHSKAQIQALSTGSLFASDPDIRGEEIHSASLASDGADVTTPSADLPFSSQTLVKTQASPALPLSSSGLEASGSAHADLFPSLAVSMQPAPHTNGATPPVPNRPMSYMTSGSSQQAHSFYMDSKAHSFNEATVDTESQLEAQQRPWEQSGQQGKDHQATGLYRYSSRAMSWSGSASLPRGYRRSEGSSRLSAVVTARPFGTKPARVSSLPRLNNDNDDKNLVLNRENNKSVQPTRPTLNRQVATLQIRGPYQATFGKQEEKVHHSDMRVSLSLKPNSRPDFGFQTHWDSTSTRVTFVQRGSPAELCQLRVGDEIVAVNGISVARMSSDQWKSTMTSALQTGSLTMDLRRYGSDDWGTNGVHSTQPCPTWKTLNLTAAAPVLIGRPEHHVTLSNSTAATENAVTNSTQLNDGTGTEAIDGEFANNNRCTSRKEYERIVMKNKKRRDDFFKRKGGSESAISDLQVPSLSPSSSNWSWDHDEERRRQERWQEEQERLLQEQYRRDQERLEAEWRQAQQDTLGGEAELNQNTCMVASVAVSTQPSLNGVACDERKSKQSPGYNEVTSKSQRTGEEEQTDKLTEPDWAAGFGLSQLSPADRTKSNSSPVLAGPHKQPRGDPRKRKGRSVSRAEQERQQILEEMKKRTQLLNDNSWIRQRSHSNAHKEPVYTGAPLRRHESLDNILTTWHQYPGSSTTTMPSHSRPQSAAASYGVPGRSPSPRCSVGAALPPKQASWSTDPPCTSQPYDEPGGSLQYARLLSGKRTCCVCERVLGRGAAMVIEALGLCFHLACFQCVNCCRHLGGTGTGVQVRMRNRKPFCEFCYFHLKYTSTL